MTENGTMSGHQDRADTAPSAGELADSVRTLALTAEPISSKAARRFVVAALDEWGRDELSDDAAVCTAELTTNAILHSRGQFAVAVRRTVKGARIDVIDGRPDRLPVTVPSTLDPLDTGTTGRGLRMVATLAERWGYFTTEVAKTVWVELGAGQGGPRAIDPVVELVDQVEPAAGITIALTDVPARVAIASGVQVDELVRIVQLHQGDLTEEDRAAFAELVDRSARPRLVGRQEAFRAAADGRTHYTVRFSAATSELVAVAELSVLLERLSAQLRYVGIVVGDDVLAMRAWINSEVVAQQSGHAPTPYDGPGAATS